MTRAEAQSQGQGGSRDFFEQWDPDQFGSMQKFQRSILAFTKGQISGDVLDLGCGSRVYYDLTNAKSWTGVDISQRMMDGITFPKDSDIEKKMVQGDALSLPFDDNSFDTVSAFFFLHHLGKRDGKLSGERVQKAFEEAQRVLRPGGTFLVGENCRGWMEEIYHWSFPLIYAAALRMKQIEMPFFWRRSQYFKFGKGLFNDPDFVTVPVTDWVYQPIFRTKIPPILSADWIQKMTIFAFEKPSELSDTSN